VGGGVSCRCGVVSHTQLAGGVRWAIRGHSLLLCDINCTRTLSVVPHELRGCDGHTTLKCFLASPHERAAVFSEAEGHMDPYLKNEEILSLLCGDLDIHAPIPFTGALSQRWVFRPRFTPGYVVCLQVSFRLLVVRFRAELKPPGLGSIIFGYDLGVIAGVLPAPNFIVRHFFAQGGTTPNVWVVQETMGPRYEDPNLLGLITSIFGACSQVGCPTPWC
jgi:hypothetical protein